MKFCHDVTCLEIKDKNSFETANTACFMVISAAR